jgi:hypothetical protein
MVVGIYHGGTEGTEKNWGKSRETRVKSRGRGNLETRFRRILEQLDFCSAVVDFPPIKG